MPARALLLDAPPPRAPVTSLVPQERFGAVLHRARVLRGRSLAELGRSADGRWLPDQLVAVERGQVALSDRRVAELTTLYGLGSSSWSSPRLDVVLDRSTARDLAPTADGTAGESPETLVTRFVAVALVGGLDLSAPRPCEVLAEALDLGVADVLDVVGDVLTVGADAVRVAVDDLTPRPVVAEAGLLVGATPAGSLVVTSHRGGVVVPACCALGDLLVGESLRAAA